MHTRWLLPWVSALFAAWGLLGAFSAPLLLDPAPAVAQEVINVNTADEKTLTQLPGIGKTTAARIIEHRNANGPFKTPRDLLQVKGIGEKTFAKFEALITCGPGGAAAPGSAAQAPPQSASGAPAPAMGGGKGRDAGDDIDLTQPPVRGEGRGAGRGTPAGAGGEAAAAPAPQGDLVNINTADEKALTKLPGVGKVTAARIVEHRNANGPFKTVDDLSQVKGIGKATLEKLRPHATVR